MRVPDDAGDGKAKVRISMPKVKGLEILAREVEVTVRKAPADVEDPK